MLTTVTVAAQRTLGRRWSTFSMFVVVELKTASGSPNSLDQEVGYFQAYLFFFFFFF